ncbi:MAG: hypothetical protein RRA92_08485 [Gemmatimonadota bacterium]|nr:hypothetical protein [Gemmatimonadota bacterium]
MTPEQEMGGHVIPEAIRDLLARRTRFQEWLEKLDDLRENYRPEVAERVREDYRGRLDEVEKEIRSHRSELESALADRRGALDDLVRRHGERAARLEEAEIRFRVGEHDEETWNHLRAESEAELAEVTEARDREREAVSEIERVLAEVEGAEARPATRRVEPGAWTNPPDPEPDADPQGTDDADAEDESAAAAAAGAVALAGPEAGSEAGPEAEDTLRDEDEAEHAPDAEAADEGPAAVEAGGDGDEQEFADDLEFLESLSLDDPDSFDAVSRMLDEDEEGPDDERGGSG